MQTVLHTWTEIATRFRSRDIELLQPVMVEILTELKAADPDLVTIWGMAIVEDVRQLDVGETPMALDARRMRELAAQLRGDQHDAAAGETWPPPRMPNGMDPELHEVMLARCNGLTQRRYVERLQAAQTRLGFVAFDGWNEKAPAHPGLFMGCLDLLPANYHSWWRQHMGPQYDELYGASSAETAAEVSPAVAPPADGEQTQPARHCSMCGCVVTDPGDEEDAVCADCRAFVGAEAV